MEDQSFADIVAHVSERGFYGYEGAALDRFLKDRLRIHRLADGSASLQRMADGSYNVV